MWKPFNTRRILVLSAVLFSLNTLADDAPERSHSDHAGTVAKTPRREYRLPELANLAHLVIDSVWLEGPEADGDYVVHLSKSNDKTQDAKFVKARQDLRDALVGQPIFEVLAIIS